MYGSPEVDGRMGSAGYSDCLYQLRGQGCCAGVIMTEQLLAGDKAKFTKRSIACAHTHRITDGSYTGT